MRLALRASLLAAILGGLLAPVAAGSWPMYTYSNLSHDGGVVFSYVETDLDMVSYCGWGCGGMYCWEEYTSFARATLYVDYDWVGSYWYEQANGWASAWAYADAAPGVWMLQAEHGLPYVAYMDDYCLYGWLYNLYEERYPWPEVTVDPEISISGEQYVDDGGAGYFYVTVELGDPTLHSWSYGYDSGGGNYPNVDFSDPWSSSTLTDGHWYASPNDACSAGRQAQYSITATVEFDHPLLTLYDTTSLTVTLPEIGGATYGPSLIPHIWTEPSNGQWIVSPQTYFVRTDPAVLKGFTSQSQFYEKVVAHEDVHVDQYMPGGEHHLNEDLYNPTAARNLIIGLTDATQAGLELKIIAAYNPWIQNQANEDNYVRRANAEAQAYAVSDGMTPQYKYQSQCGGGL